MGARRCSRCARALPPDANFCPACGAAADAETGVFRPHWRLRDTLAVGWWAAAAALALGQALGSLEIPPAGQTVTGTAAAWWLARMVAALLAAGIVGGVFVRADGRYRELALGGYALGCRRRAARRRIACDTPAEGFGAGIFAAFAAVVVVLGALGGRLGRRRIRRRPA